MRKLLMLVLAVSTIWTHVAAQTRTVTGRVTDANGQPLSNASVTVRGTNVGTVTDANGNYSINVPAGGTTIVVSSVGFGEKQISIGNQTSISVSLAAGSGQGLDEVVVVGYQARRKRDEAGAISSVTAQQIENLPVASVDRALQGRAAGVVVQANNGIPGGAITVRVRGVGSINAGNSPLYVVDGVQLNSATNTTFTQSNPLAFLNPNDIESIDILKDAASAAIYGASASNGVVIITTKKGRAGKTRVTLNTYVGQSSALRKLDVVDSREYFELRTEAVGNANNLAANNLAVRRNVLGVDFRVPNAANFDDKQIDSALAATQTYDWQDAAFRKGPVQNYELGISGGNDRTTFRISGNYNQQQAIIRQVDFERAGLNVNLSNKATDKLTITTGLNVSTFDQKGPFGGGGGSSLGNIAFSASGTLPFNPIFNPDGTFFGLPPNNLSGVLSQNAVAVTELNTINQRTNQLIGNIAGDYKLLNWLNFLLDRQN